MPLEFTDGASDRRRPAVVPGAALKPGPGSRPDVILRQCEDVHRHHHRRRPHRRRPRPRRHAAARQAPDDRGAGRLPRRRRPRRQHRAQRRLHDRHPLDAGRRRFTIDISAEAWTRPPAWASPARSTWKRPCARTTGWAATSCRGHVDGIGAVTPVRAGRREPGSCASSRRATLAKFLAYKGSITVNGVSLTVNRVGDRPTAANSAST